MAALAPAYLPRRPTETVLYRAGRENLETFLAHTREAYERPLPRYVEQELRAFLRCGVFSHGFVRCHCDTCGHDLLVAFSCKSRTACPSCAGRRMANTGATIVDRVLPDVPVHQYVLSLPFELRKLAAFRADVLTALGRIFVESIFASYDARAKRNGITGAQCGAVNFVQRFGSSVNVHVHFHVVVLDGSSSETSRGPSSSTPLLRLHERSLARSCGASSVARWRGCVDTATSTTAMGRGQLATLRNADTDEPEDDREDPHGKSAGAVERDGFNLHAAVRICLLDQLVLTN